MKIGDKVTWKSPNTSDGESSSDRMEVLELRGDRILVKFLGTGMSIEPTTNLQVSDVKVANSIQNETSEQEIIDLVKAGKISEARRILKKEKFGTGGEIEAYLSSMERHTKENSILFQNATLHNGTAEDLMSRSGRHFVKNDTTPEQAREIKSQINKGLGDGVDEGILAKEISKKLNVPLETIKKMIDIYKYL